MYSKGGCCRVLQQSFFAATDFFAPIRKKNNLFRKFPPCAPGVLQCPCALFVATIREKPHIVEMHNSSAKITAIFTNY